MGSETTHRKAQGQTFDNLSRYTLSRYRKVEALSLGMRRGCTLRSRKQTPEYGNIRRRQWQRCSQHNHRQEM
jgi:hypothetical protein